MSVDKIKKRAEGLKPFGGSILPQPETPAMNVGPGVIRGRRVPPVPWTPPPRRYLGNRTAAPLPETVSGPVRARARRRQKGAEGY